MKKVSKTNPGSYLYPVNFPVVIGNHSTLANEVIAESNDAGEQVSRQKHYGRGRYNEMIRNARINEICKTCDSLLQAELWRQYVTVKSECSQFCTPTKRKKCRDLSSHLIEFEKLLLNGDDKLKAFCLSILSIFTESIDTAAKKRDSNGKIKQKKLHTVPAALSPHVDIVHSNHNKNNSNSNWSEIFYNYLFKELKELEFVKTLRDSSSKLKSTCSKLKMEFTTLSDTLCFSNYLSGSSAGIVVKMGMTTDRISRSSFAEVCGANNNYIHRIEEVNRHHVQFVSNEKMFSYSYLCSISLHNCFVAQQYLSEHEVASNSNILSPKRIEKLSRQLPSKWGHEKVLLKYLDYSRDKPDNSLRSSKIENSQNGETNTQDLSFSNEWLSLYFPNNHASHFSDFKKGLSSDTTKNIRKFAQRDAIGRELLVRHDGDVDLLAMYDFKCLYINSLELWDSIYKDVYNDANEEVSVFFPQSVPIIPFEFTFLLLATTPSADDINSWIHSLPCKENPNFNCLAILSSLDFFIQHQSCIGNVEWLRDGLGLIVHCENRTSSNWSALDRMEANVIVFPPATATFALEFITSMIFNVIQMNLNRPDDSSIIGIGLDNSTVVLLLDIIAFYCFNNKYEECREHMTTKMITHVTQNIMLVNLTMLFDDARVQSKFFLNQMMRMQQ